jgi:hypothetical protein
VSDHSVARCLARLLAEVGDALTRGCSIVIQVPQYGTAALQKAIEEEAKLQAGRRPWGRVRLPPIPCDWCCDDLAAEIGRPWAVAKGLNALIQDASFRRAVVWIDGVDERVCPALYGFLDQYQRLSQDLGDAERPCLLACVPGTASGAPAGSPRVKVLRWRNRVLRVDTSIAVGAWEASGEEVPLLRAVRHALAAELAQWDLALAEDMSRHTLEELLVPGPLIEEWRRRQGWPPEAISNPTWENGLVDTLDGVPQLHAVALLGRPGGLSRRIWSGMVTVLFPVLEEIRRGLIERYVEILVVPWSPARGVRTVEEVDDLELSHLLGQLKHRTTTLAPELLEGLRIARDLRNDLAHFRPAASAALGSPALRALIDHVRDFPAVLGVR